jgi:predicted ABC-type ATPase
MPTLYLIGVPNGAGKTTFARGFLQGPRAHLGFLNADEVARGYSPFDPPYRMAMAAGRYMLTEAKRLIQAKESFVMESTLSGFPCQTSAGCHGNRLRCCC